MLELAAQRARDSAELERVYREMASLLLSEGKDATLYLLLAEWAREEWTNPSPRERDGSSQA